MPQATCLPCPALPLCDSPTAAVHLHLCFLFTPLVVSFGLPTPRSARPSLAFALCASASLPQPYPTGSTLAYRWPLIFQQRLPGLPPWTSGSLIPSRDPKAASSLPASPSDCLVLYPLPSPDLQVHWHSSHRLCQRLSRSGFESDSVQPSWAAGLSLPKAPRHVPE